MTHEDYMRRAISLAKKGAGHVSPNPLVGAVIVKDGQIIGEGYHMVYGDLHAERNALKNCSQDPKGATIYVTLEPCCHTGKQPPCTEALIQAGIKTLYCGSNDPNPKVSGKGFQLLREAGLEVHTQFLKEECDQLNDIFFHYITTGKPYVTLKYAMTLDGKIACHTGDSRWITGSQARQDVFLDRNRYSAILVGLGTILADDPMLTARIPGGVDPIRILVDTNLKTPLQAKLVNTANQIPTILATTVADPLALTPYKDAGLKIWVLPKKDDQVDLKALVDQAGNEGIDSIYVEGGGRIHWSFLKDNLADSLICYIGPKLVGGSEAKTPVEGTGLSLMSKAKELENLKVCKLGEDLKITGRLKQEDC